MILKCVPIFRLLTPDLPILVFQICLSPNYGSSRKARLVWDLFDQIHFPGSSQKLIELRSPLPRHFCKKEGVTVEHYGTKAVRYLVDERYYGKQTKLRIHKAVV